MESRRRFLKLCGGLPPLVLGCTGDEGTAAQGEVGPVAAGSASDYAVGTLTLLRGHSVALGRDVAGFYALTTLCTHASCDIATQGSVTNRGLRCGCHESTFDETGKRTGGPAPRDLDHFAVEIDGAGAITVQAGTVVDASARVAPPA